MQPPTENAGMMQGINPANITPLDLVAAAFDPIQAAALADALAQQYDPPDLSVLPDLFQFSPPTQAGPPASPPAAPAGPGSNPADLRPGLPTAPGFGTGSFQGGDINWSALLEAARNGLTGMLPNVVQGMLPSEKEPSVQEQVAAALAQQQQDAANAAQNASQIGTPLHIGVPATRPGYVSIGGRETPNWAALAAPMTVNTPLSEAFNVPAGNDFNNIPANHPLSEESVRAAIAANVATGGAPRTGMGTTRGRAGFVTGTIDPGSLMPDTSAESSQMRMAREMLAALQRGDKQS